MFFKRVGGGCTLRVWGCISYKGNVNLYVFEENMTLDYSANVLQNYLISNADALCGENWVLKHENVAVHSSNVTESFLKANVVELMD